MLRATEVTDPAPAIILAATLGQWHDVGALIVALTAGKNGSHQLYQGPNLPAEDTAAGAKQSGVRAVVTVSVSHLRIHHPLIEELRKLRRYLDREVTIFVGGSSGCRLRSNFRRDQ